MNRKIILTLSLALIAIVMASAASADENVTIDGIDFNIPDGFTEDVDEAIINETNSEHKVSFVSNAKVYENGDHIMTLMVCTYEGVNVTNDYLKDMDGDDLTINGVDGKLTDTGFIKVFCYVKDGKLAELSTNYQEDIEKFVVDEI